MSAQTGTVASWNEERGMGFIKPMDGTPDRFVHRSALTDGQALTVGTTVSFTGGYDSAKGKPIVTACSGAVANGVETMAAGGLDGGSFQTGTVKAWMEERGMGFITPSEGGEDLFVHRSWLMDGQSLTVGALVTFDSDFDEQKNKNVAKNVYGSGEPVAKGAGKGPVAFATNGGAASLAQAALNATGSTAAALAELDAARAALLGKPQSYGAPPQSYGAPPPGYGPPQGYGAAPQGYGAVPVRVAAPRASPYGLVQPVAAVQPVVVMPGRTLGVVKSWVEERGMGFIAPSQGGDDHFVHRSSLNDGDCLAIGSTVQFEAVWDAQKNKPVARNVTGATGAGGAPAAVPVQSSLASLVQPVPQIVLPSRGPQVVLPMQAPQGIQTGAQNGTVKTWYEARGMGFIAPANGSTDFFVHRSSLLDGNSLQEGSQVSFEGNWDPVKSKPIAKNVQGAITA